MELYSKAKIAPIGKVNDTDLKKMAKNLLIFTAPILVVFFGQLAAGVEWKAAGAVALLAVYGVIADFLKKIAEK